MNYLLRYFYCSENILQHMPEVDQIKTIINETLWEKEFEMANGKGKVVQHQTAYNESFDQRFVSHDWERQPLIAERPRRVGDFRKEGVIVESQFGNAATLYGNYYKFQYALAQGKLTLAVLIVPACPKKFFPTRPKSVSNMASFGHAERILTLLPIPVPILLIGLLPE